MNPKKTTLSDPHRCKYCIHFHQHYVKISVSPERYIPCYCGHCTARNAKSVKEDRTCDDFLQKTE